MRIGDIPQKNSRGARPRYADRGRSGSNNTKQPFGLTGKSLPHSDSQVSSGVALPQPAEHEDSYCHHPTAHHPDGNT